MIPSLSSIDDVLSKFSNEFDFIRKIGKGTYGEVFEVTKKSNNSCEVSHDGIGQYFRKAEQGTFQDIDFKRVRSRKNKQYALKVLKINKYHEHFKKMYGLDQSTIRELTILKALSFKHLNILILYDFFFFNNDTNGKTCHKTFLNDNPNVNYLKNDRDLIVQIENAPRICFLSEYCDTDLERLILERRKIFRSNYNNLLNLINFHRQRSKYCHNNIQDKGILLEYINKKGFFENKSNIEKYNTNYDGKSKLSFNDSHSIDNIDFAFDQKEYRPGLTIIETKILIYQLLQALKFCHSRRIMHRDLKPANIFLKTKLPQHDRKRIKILSDQLNSSFPSLNDNEEKLLSDMISTPAGETNVITDAKQYCKETSCALNKQNAVKLPNQKALKCKNDSHNIFMGSKHRISFQDPVSMKYDDNLDKIRDSDDDDICSLVVSPGLVKIGDFGLSTLFNIEKDEVKTEEIVTLFYRPPEIILGYFTYNFQIDIWAAAAIMGECILGKPIFSAGSDWGVLMRIFTLLGTPKMNESQTHFLEKLKHFTEGIPQITCDRLKNLKGIFSDEFGRQLLDDCGIDLLNKMLDLNPNTRISADEAIEHDWFHGTEKYLPEKLIDSYKPFFSLPKHFLDPEMS